MVGGHLDHGAAPEDDEGEDIAQAAQHDQHGRHVQQQGLQQPVLRHLHQHRLVALHLHPAARRGHASSNTEGAGETGDAVEWDSVVSFCL